MGQERPDLVERQKKWDAIVQKKEEWLQEHRRRRLESRDKSIPNIKDFYAGKSVLITGGTGFLGKVLIEKFLRSVPDLKCIYVLVRTKKNQNPADRIANILDSDLFDLLRQDRPEALKKVVAIAGDMSAKGIGLSEEDKSLLQNEISVVIHAAASVRFDDPLKEAVLLNTRGTREIIDLSKGMKNLKAFVHVSTTYCNTKEPITMEKVYPTPFDWRNVIRIAEENALDDLQAVAPKILGYQPNTYTFTKQLAEKVVDDARHEIPVFIIRPSVVMCIMHEPIPGWIDNLYGSSGFGVGYLKGILRTFYADENIHLNYIPADAVAKSLIASGWFAGTNQKLNDDLSATDVGNMTGEDICDATNMDCVEALRQYIPTLRPKSLLAPRFKSTQSYYVYHFKVCILLLFSVFIDVLLRLAGQKPLLTRVFRKVYYANMSLLYFTLHKYPNATETLWKGASYVTDIEFQHNAHHDFVGLAQAQMKHIFQHVLKEDQAGPHHHIILECLHCVQETIKYCLYAWVAWTFGSLLIRRGFSYLDNLP